MACRAYHTYCDDSCEIVQVKALREENARLVEERQAAWECAKRTRHERDEARAELARVAAQRDIALVHGPEDMIQALEAAEAKLARLEGLILEAEADIKAMGTEAHPAVLMRLDRLIRRMRHDRHA